MLKAIAADKRRIVDIIFSFTLKNTTFLCKDHHNLECYKPQTNVKPLLQSSALTLDITSVFGNRYPLKWTSVSLRLCKGLRRIIIQFCWKHTFGIVVATNLIYGKFLNTTRVYYDKYMAPIPTTLSTPNNRLYSVELLKKYKLFKNYVYYFKIQVIPLISSCSYIVKTISLIPSPFQM